MLTLGLRLGESIYVDGHKIVLIEVRRDKVKLGFDFPQDVPIHREKIYQELKAKGRTHIKDNPFEDMNVPAP